MARSALTCASFLSATLSAAAELGDTPAERAFRDFLDEFRPTYSSEEERRSRFAAFADNYAAVQEANAKGLTYQLGINEFADQTLDEFRATHVGTTPPGGKANLWAGATYLGRHNYTGEVLSDSVDWVAKGAVTGVKDQKSCGSCYAFSATGALEGASQLAGHGLVPLSEQQIVACSKVWFPLWPGNHGCLGGFMDYAFKWWVKNGACSEEDYPYENRDGTCKKTCKPVLPMGSVLGYKDVSKLDEQALLSAVMQQPVSVAIFADWRAFMLYKHGVITMDCEGQIDHGVLCVGFGTEGGVAYWKIKNSWGPRWGEKGFVRLQRGGKGETGQCGIASEPSFPIVKKAGRAQLVV